MATLPDRLLFQQRSLDENGDRLGPWEAGFQVAARVEYLRGSEPAVENRLQSIQPVTILVRDGPQTRTIKPKFRAIVQGRGPRAGEVFNITADAPAKEYGYFNLMGTSGGADG